MNRAGDGPGAPVRSGPRVLILRPDHLGDLLLTLPAIAALRRRLPGAQVTAMVPRPLLDVARRAVDIDEVRPMPVAMPDPPPKRESATFESAAAELRDSFDLALLPRPSDPWSGALTAAAGVPLRVGHRQPATLPFLTHAFGERPSQHVAREAVVLALRAADLLGVANERAAPRVAPGGRLRLLPEDETVAAALLAHLGVSHAPPVVVHPAAGWPLKSWPVERWVRLVRGLAEAMAGTVLVVGQKGDTALLHAITDGAGGNAHPVDDLSIGGLAALHARARLVVGIDSGALHLAAMFGAPVVGLFGPFAPHRVAPLAAPDRLRALWTRLPCSPCGTLDQPPCRAVREPACLLAISVERVVAEAVAVASKWRGRLDRSSVRLPHRPASQSG